MAEQKTDRMAAARAARKATAGQQRPPMNDMSAMRRIRNILDQLPEGERAGVVAWLVNREANRGNGQQPTF